MSSSTRFGRLAQLGTLTTKVASRAVGAALRGVFQDEETQRRANEALHIDNAREIAQAMSRMKGAAMKLGQQLAVLGASLDLPPEVSSALGSLNHKAEPIPFEQIKEDVEAAIERPLQEAFRWFDPAPLGTASLAQAHVARLRSGEEVVVKVLHRGIEQTLDADLLALRAVLLSGKVLRRDPAEVEEAFDEIRARLKEELDYLQEAVNLQAYYELFKDHPHLRVPRLYGDWCTERVLVMDRLPGRHLDEWLASEPAREARQRAGETLLDLYYQQLFRHRMLLADPHPGNYLFEDDGRIGLLDFGCVKRFDEFWMGTYATAALGTRQGDKAKVLQACQELGAWDGRHPEDGELLWDFCEGIGHGFRGGRRRLGSRHEQMMEEMKPILQRFLKNPRVRVPRHVLFAHRSLGGLYSMLRALETEADFGAVLESHAQVAIARATGRAP